MKHVLWLVLYLSSPAEKKIVLLAGPLDSHPKDTHEYERNVILLKHCLDTSPSVQGAKVELHLGGWPEDPRTLDDADTIVITSGGCDHHLEDHPFYVGDRLGVLKKQMDRGCGLVQFHWSTFNPSRHHEAVTEWVGGTFDYETGPGGKWYSAIETREWTTALGAPDHPLSRGLRPFKLKEEFYFNLRFRDPDPRLVPILQKEAGGDLRKNTVAYAVERSNGGRGFGFTGGHFYANWWIPEFRKLVLNAIVWTAHLPVPEEGVSSTLEPPLRALILTGHHHPAHDWRATTAALVHALEQDPRLKVEVTENPEDLAGPKMENLGLLVQNYNNWDRPGLSEAAKAGFRKHLERGGGLLIVHFANGAWNATLPNKESEWEEYRTRIVRRAWMHPESAHDDYGAFRVEVAKGSHPVTQGLGAFDTMDELYFHQGGDLPVEPLAWARSKKTGQDEPLAFGYRVEKGRVFQTLLGHSDLSIRSAAPLIRRGAVWAARLSPLSFDPPTGALLKAFFKPGSAWTPKAQEPAKPNPDPKEKGLLPPDPGLDGGKGGHWGLTGEPDWKDGRWNQAEVGPFISSSLKIPEGTLVKAISIKVGDQEEGGVVFDAQGCSLRAGWTGRFIAFSPARYGLIEMPRIAGELRWTTPAGPRGRYRSLSLRGNRVSLSYDLGSLHVSETPWLEKRGDLLAFSRSFRIGGEGEALLPLASLQGATGKEETVEGVPLAVLRSGENVTAAALVGGGPGRLAVANGFEIDYRAKPTGEGEGEKILLFGGKAAELAEFAALVKGTPPPKGISAVGGGPRWSGPLNTQGHVSPDPGPYVLDTLTLPYENPWKALLFLSGLDFFENGDAAVSTVHGEVWTVSGIDSKLGKLSWRRYATGLYQPLGLKIVKNEVYVLGRDQITRLRDPEGRGEASIYENFSSDLPSSAAGHDYIACLETDTAGRFYYASTRGLFRVSSDGATTELLAGGFRNPNGLSIGPGGTITVAPQEGEWVPASQICEVKPGDWYGYAGPRAAPDRPSGVTPPLCYLPRILDNSTGGQVWVEGDRWGPLEGQLLNLSYGRCSMQLVLRETVGGRSQGGAVPFKLSFSSGVMRGRFRPADGQLYVCGLKGWVSSAVRDGCLQRVRYTGAKVRLPVALHAKASGLEITFSVPLDREMAESLDSYAIEQWNYHYSEKYGSEEYSVTQPDRVGHDPVEVRSARLLGDSRTVHLEIPALKPVMQMRIRYSLRDAEGQGIRGEIDSSLHRLP
jgi:type 1 glutamine amidotransferase/glucose/arabinose dehydrogenase